MDGFAALHAAQPFDRVAARIQACTDADVERALGCPQPGADELAALLSPAAVPRLEELAQRAHALSLARFGRTVSLYAPLYLSNVCRNACVYCGFRADRPADTRTLTPAEARAEGEHLAAQGMRHLLLVAGEAPELVSQAYLGEVAARLRPLFASLSVEIQPLETEGYAALAAAGVDGLVVYQETYDPVQYAALHPRGPKSDMTYRLLTPERAGRAGLRRVGLGALLGLADVRAEAWFLGLHARHLMRHHWRSHLSLSFPRLRPSAGRFEPPRPATDRELVQLICALRLFLPDAGLVLSTREPPELRDRLVPLGITSMSAGSCTEPGGYGRRLRAGRAATPQFEVADLRSPAEVAAALKRQGYEAVWKDWDPGFMG
ncbi:MAG TPA: 2-iminoacetate synthase ThiH [Myxococcota bacterium]|nr:2-iminoacetate synthase ThiH [Myxococcota bacterium]HRY93052.1 2-iminoacetate synthase ThiH [Myxococcota bacterium]HSA21593.1 2-iminoacetate synthase ThiH [Myxococcota bacterium]